MEKNILIINTGSASKKYSLYLDGNLSFNAHLERDKDKYVVTFDEGGEQDISKEEYENGISYFFDTAKKTGKLDESVKLWAIGLRLVAPGKYFTDDHIIDNEFLEKLSTMEKSDLAHIGSTKEEINQAKELFPEVKIVAVSDSSFHKTMPEVASSYAIPESLANEKDLQRFGFHGISIASLVNDFASKPDGIEKRTIACHLGSGASITALLDGKSVDTSMGYSPLEGIPMSSRVGNIDVGAVLHLAETKSVSDLQELFYTQCGFLGISGLSDDMRVLLEAEKNNHDGAHSAIEMFVYNIRKHIGAYAGALGGLDAIVFSGTMGERSFVIRERICRDLGWLGVSIDPDKNQKAVSGAEISNGGSVRVYVMHCDEAGEILRRTVNMI